MPPTLEQVLNAPYNYEKDLIVTFSYNENSGRIDGFQYATFSESINSGSTGYTWKEENSHLATPQINTILTEWGYRPIIKRDNKVPFDTCWDYRLIIPSWSTFRLWLYVFYAHMEVNGERTDQERDECRKILGKVGTLGDSCPSIHEVHTWVEQQYECHVRNPNREVKYLYSDLIDILEKYANWAGTEKVNG